MVRHARLIIIQKVWKKNKWKLNKYRIKQLVQQRCYRVSSRDMSGHVWLGVQSRNKWTFPDQFDHFKPSDGAVHHRFIHRKLDGFAKYRPVFISLYLILYVFSFIVTLWHLVLCSSLPLLSPFPPLAKLTFYSTRCIHVFHSPWHRVLMSPSVGLLATILLLIL